MRYLLLLSLTMLSFGQSTLNPNISILGDIRLQHEKISNGKDTDFRFYGAEVVIENYLNPFAKAWTTIHFSDEEKTDIEEAYITIIKGLPFNSQIRFGRYFLTFGEIIQKHTHALAFMDYPKMHQAYFGDEGTRNIGLEVNFAFPVMDQFTELKLNMFEGNLMPESYLDRDSITQAINPPLAFNAYYSIFTEVTDFSHLKTSFSYIYGAADQDYNEKIKMMALALKYKWVPSDYTHLEILSEFFMNDRVLKNPQNKLESIQNSGFFASLDYKFAQLYNVGFSYDNYEDPFINKGKSLEDLSVFAGFAPIEETLLIRLKYSRDISLKENKVQLQAIFSLGPHKAHQF